MRENPIYNLKLPTPPSVNALWRITGRRMYRSKKYMDFIKDCEATVAWQNHPTIDYPFNIEIVVGRPSKRRMDIDNRGKAVMDILQHLKIIEDDCMAQQITMMWTDAFKHTEVTIWKAVL
jgi:crossover junction endodeoxyribonuclease RusA|tara:strand:- start:1145 stop:1504 length:360 start_codon:yes stop_codon:yes gene_type:complete